VDGVEERFIEKSRGFWEEVNIEQVEELVDELDSTGEIIGEKPEFRGLYKLTFVNFNLPPHSQYNSNGVSVEWHGGIVRLKRKTALENGERDTFEVLKMETSGSNLVLYINDSTFNLSETSETLDENPYDKILTGKQLINYYPGYKVYLYADSTKNLTEPNILPAQDEGVRYSVFGLRSKNSEKKSRMSTPTLMFAQELVEPKTPLLALASKYATRPDFFGKASYTLMPEFVHNPNSILFYRSNDESFPAIQAKYIGRNSRRT
jgi:hypothetical protein